MKRFLGFAIGVNLFSFDANVSGVGGWPNLVFESLGWGGSQKPEKSANVKCEHPPRSITSSPMYETILILDFGVGLQFTFTMLGGWSKILKICKRL